MSYASERLEEITGCTDGACIIKRPVGMHTNGGCRCERVLVRCGPDGRKAAMVLRLQQQRIRELTEETWDGAQKVYHAKRIAALEAALKHTTAHLVAAVSLLERSPKTAAPSDKMFDQMLKDYRRSIEVGRAALLPGRGD